LVRFHGVLDAAGFVRDHAEVEPVERRRCLPLNRRMKIVQRFGKALLSIGDQAEKMESFGMVGRELERLTVRGFCLRQPVRLLMDASLLEPSLDRLR
jgi:hypothetical protein